MKQKKGFFYSLINKLRSRRLSVYCIGDGKDFFHLSNDLDLISLSSKRYQRVDLALDSNLMIVCGSLTEKKRSLIIKRYDEMKGLVLSWGSKEFHDELSEYLPIDIRVESSTVSSKYLMSILRDAEDLIYG